MSQNDGIYILETKGPEYRVGYHLAIDSIYGEFSDESYQWQGNPESMYQYFHADKMFSTLEEALDYAEELVYNYEYLEDGICVIHTFNDWDFGKLEEQYGKEDQDRQST